MLDNPTELSSGFQQLADARRALRVANSLRKAPVLPADERLLLEQTRALAIRVIEAATAELIETLDALDDPDAEPNGDELDGERAEDEAGAELYANFEGGPGCPISDPDCGVEDQRHDPDEGV